MPDSPLPDLSPQQQRRYSRHCLIPEITAEGQKRLLNSCLLMVGCGGLGCAVGPCLAAAGVGEIRCLDDDRISLSNLQRQTVFRDEDIGKLKAEVMGDFLKARHPEGKISCYTERLTPHNAMEFVRGVDLVVDGTDNFSARYIINEACLRTGIPWVYGSVYRFEGQVAVFGLPDGPCYRCLQPEPPDPGDVPTCAEGGVLGAIPAVIGGLQSVAALKYLAGVPWESTQQFHVFDGIQGSVRAVKLAPDPECPACQSHGKASGETPISIPKGCQPLAGTSTAWWGGGYMDELEARGQKVTLLDVRSNHETALMPVAGARNIPLPQLANELHQLDSRQTYLVLCSGSERTRRACQLLKDAGIQRVGGFPGGVEAWLEERKHQPG